LCCGSFLLAVTGNLFLLASPAASLHSPPIPEVKRLNLNTASAEELDSLPEVGPRLARAIIAFREKSGPFRRVEDLLAVPGISKRRLEKIRPHIYVEPKKTQDSEPTPEIHARKGGGWKSGSLCVVSCATPLAMTTFGDNNLATAPLGASQRALDQAQRDGDQQREELNHQKRLQKEVREDGRAAQPNRFRK
jgi:competence ComEA-like helix-hairpin-helix protein